MSDSILHLYPTSTRGQMPEHTAEYNLSRNDILGWYENNQQTRTNNIPNIFARKEIIVQSLPSKQHLVVVAYNLIPTNILLNIHLFF